MEATNMCWQCVLEEAKKLVINDQVVSAFRLMEARDDDIDYSMFLHIVVEDYNVGDHLFDLTEPERKQRYDAAEPWERRIHDALAALTVDERLTALAMRDEYISRDGTLREGLPPFVSRRDDDDTEE